MQLNRISLISFLIFFNCILCVGQNFTEIDKVVASDREPSAWFGYDVSISGDYAAIGAHNQDFYPPFNSKRKNAGAVYIYKFSNGQWIQIQKFMATNAFSEINFGFSVALNDSTLVIGARSDGLDSLNTNNLYYAGSAFIYKLGTNGLFSQTQKITAKNRGYKAHFGYSVAFSDSTIVIGAPGESYVNQGTGYLDKAGAAYLFKQNANGRWLQVQKLVASDRDTVDEFGISVSISGKSAVIGSSSESNDILGQNYIQQSGSAYIFEETTTGSWVETQKLVSTDREVTGMFGWKIAMDSNFVLISAYQEKKDSVGLRPKVRAGAVYLYKKSTGGTWVQHQKLVAWNRASFDQFGYDIDIEGDYILVGARNREHILQGITPVRVGATYVFKKNINGRFIKRQMLQRSGISSGDYFGSSVGISGLRFVIGDIAETTDEFDANPLTAAGAAYFYGPCINTSDTIADTACSSYTSPSGNHIWTSTGLHTDLLRSKFGCDSLIVVDLYIYASTAPFKADTNAIKYPQCSYSADGQLAITISGGKPPYTINWSTGDTTLAISNLSGGNYWVNIIDAVGCSDSLHFNLAAPDSLVPLSVIKTNVSCNGAIDGSISINMQGGSPPYNYLWSTGDTASTLSNLSTGIYHVSVSDSLGCSFADSFQMDEPNSLLIDLIRLKDACYNETDGSITIQANGGSYPYKYLWSNGQQSSSISNLTKGAYSLTVTDSAGCIATRRFNIQESDSLTIRQTGLVEATCRKPNGQVNINVEGGAKPYNIEWDNGEQGDQLINVRGGKYTVTVRDKNDCSSSVTFNLGDQSQEKVFFANTFTPNGDGVNDTYELLGNPDCFTDPIFQIFNRWGEKLFETNKPFEEFWNGSVDKYAPKEDVYVFIFISNEFSESGYVKILN